MKIAVDAMGGDFAPQEIIKGAVTGARDYGVGLILVGPQEIIRQELAKYDISGLEIEILHTDQYLIEGEQPAYTLRAKRNASIALAVRQVKEGKAQAVISMGPTGGVITSALMVLGTVEGISRPVVGGAFCDFTPDCVLMDMGGNLDCRPDQLLDFAVVGTVYARKLLGVPEPAVALLNVGKEEGKGAAVLKEAYELLKRSGLNFIGNIEGNDIPSGRANVIVTDGLVGNIVTKYCEGLGKTVADWLGEELKNDLPDERLKALRRNLMSRMIKADDSGGGPVWAVNGLVFKGHGRSRAYEMAQTVKTAKTLAELDLVNALKSELLAVRSRLKASGTQQ